MSKLYQVLESTFKLRINSNAEIIPYIKRLSEMGKFDEPKKVAAIAILLDRLGKLEDEANVSRELQDIATPATNEKIEQELAEEAVKKDATILQANNAPMTGVADTIDDSKDIKTISEFTPDAISDAPAITP